VEVGGVTDGMRVCDEGLAGSWIWRVGETRLSISWASSRKENGVKGRSDEGEGNACTDAEASASDMLGGICNAGMQEVASSSDTDASGKGKAGRTASYEGVAEGRGSEREERGTRER
jgi:hypothetical protein